MTKEAFSLAAWTNGKLRVAGRAQPATWRVFAAVPEPPRPTSQRCPAAAEEAAAEQRRPASVGPVASSAAGARTLPCPGATRTPCPHAPTPARAFLSVPGAPLLSPSSGPLQTELQHESATLRAGAAAALALLDCSVWSATDAASRREGARRRQHALLGAAQSFEDWTRALAGRQEKIPQTAPPIERLNMYPPGAVLSTPQIPSLLRNLHIHLTLILLL
ncbi:hypothetical protein U0070_007355 [Myodes glareolus]|uniref:Uncharacterized protein n=1 Tax=Myodes glareolus TaxID=447135 RepID=A0AAW0HVE6_MYOGA